MIGKLLRRFAAGTALAALAASLAGSAAQASVVILPGGTANPGPDTYGTSVAPGATEVAILGPIASTTTSGGKYTLTEAVYRETGGSYDFLYQVANTGTTTIKSMSALNYFGYTTSVGYSTSSPTGFAAGTTATPIVQRGAAGADLLFAFDSGGLAAGATSDVFFVQTNALSYDSLGLGTLADTKAGLNGTGVNIGIFEPFGPAVPEPGTVTLLGCFAAFAGIGTLARRRAFRKSA